MNARSKDETIYIITSRNREAVIIIYDETNIACARMLGLKFWQEYNLAIFFQICQIAKLKSSPNFPTTCIRYLLQLLVWGLIIIIALLVDDQLIVSYIL